MQASVRAELAEGPLGRMPGGVRARGIFGDLGANGCGE